MARTPRKSSATTIIFVRHGRTPTTGKVLPGRAKGLGLSDEGRAQAQAAAERIAAAFPNVAALYASPLERTRETSAPIAAALGLEIQRDKNLLEADTGDWTGQDLRALNKLPEWKAVLNNAGTFRFPGGESFLELQARVTEFVRNACERHAGETIVAVSHADTIKAALLSAFGSPIDTIHRLTVSPCSISVVHYAPAPVVLAMNSTDLQGLKPS